ncbi:MAG: hypothetical protein AAFO07_14685 [Bacteroidota bacterium]
MRLRHEDLHSLTRKGANLLDELGILPTLKIRYPKRTPVSLSNDYLHRVSTISTHISIIQWIEKNGYRLIDILLYYDKRKQSNSRFKSETRLILPDANYLTPDLIFAYEKPN